MTNPNIEYNNKIKRENCVVCEKFIMTHSRITTCQKCKIICHAECSKKYFKYNHMTYQWFCKECITNFVPKYNPFDTLNCDKYEHFDVQQIEDIETISKILNSCKDFDVTTFNSETNILVDIHRTLIVVTNKKARLWLI